MGHFLKVYPSALSFCYITIPRVHQNIDPYYPEDFQSVVEEVGDETERGKEWYFLVSR